jgi:hypothetical protein
MVNSFTLVERAAQQLVRPEGRLGRVPARLRPRHLAGATSNVAQPEDAS